MTAAVVAGVGLVALAVTWAALRHWTLLCLWLNDAVEVSAERVPTAYAALTNLTLAIDIPRPRLYVVRGTTPVALAFRQGGRDGVAIAETVLERLSAREVQGTLALLVALLAGPGAWHRRRRPADWFATDCLATTITDRTSVTAALFALAVTQSDSSAGGGANILVTHVLGALNRNVVALVPFDPPVITRIAQLHEPSFNGEGPREG